MKNETYDRLKLWAQVIIPAFMTFVFAVANIWNIGAITQYSEQIIGTFAALDTFLGVLLKIASDRYWENRSNE